jgi:hypothetical protein
MTGLELLLTYPLSGKIVSDWAMSQMLESFKDDSVPDDFKKYMLDQGVDNDKLAVMIDAQPRALFDVFDNNDIIIYFMIFSSPEGVKFSGAIHIGHDEIKPNPIGKQCNTRKEAELFAIEAAFELLENKLSSNEITEQE